MITPYQNPEGRDDKASSFWHTLANKLGLRAPNLKQASADDLRVQRLSDGIQTQGRAPIRQGMVKVAGLTKVSAPQHLAESVFDRIIDMHRRAEAQLSQAERVKAVDFLSRIADQAEGVKGSVGACGGDQKVADLCGEITAKADAVIGAVTQLRDKASDMSVAQAEAISNAFLLINDAANYLGKKGAVEPASSPTMPEIELMDGGLPEMPPSEETPSPASAIAGHIPAMVRKAMDEAYDDMRCVHTKMLLIESMLNEIIADLNVNTMMTPGMPGDGMPPTTELPGPDTPEAMREESEEQAAAKGAEAGLEGVVVVARTDVHPIEEMNEEYHGQQDVSDHRSPPWERKRRKNLQETKKTAASGDPGDSEPGNSIYKDINKCRDCVWFESDVTHETYRDKCRGCEHAKLGGIANHWWPKAQQMVIWAPQYEGESEHVRLSVRDTLTLRQAQPDQAQSVAREIVAAADHHAVDLGEVMVDTFRNPLIASQMGTLARGIVAEVASLTGVTMARDAKDGNLIIAYPVIEQEAKGEKARIRELRTQLEGEKDPVKIKQLHDAIEALHDRISKDKERKEQRRKDRAERKEKQQAEFDKQHANIPAKTASKWKERGNCSHCGHPMSMHGDTTSACMDCVESGGPCANGIPSGSEAAASLTGSLCLADALQWPSDSPELGAGEAFSVCHKCGQEHALDTPCTPETPEERVKRIVGPGPGKQVATMDVPPGGADVAVTSVNGMPQASAGVIGTLTSRGSLRLGEIEQEASPAWVKVIAIIANMMGTNCQEVVNNPDQGKQAYEWVDQHREAVDKIRQELLDDPDISPQEIDTDMVAAFKYLKGKDRPQDKHHPAKTSPVKAPTQKVQAPAPTQPQTQVSVAGTLTSRGSL